jgi:hypothetical protein
MNKTNDKCCKEHYTYSINQPKGPEKIQICKSTVENDYGYKYALYKRERKTVITPQEEKKWQGVL